MGWRQEQEVQANYHNQSSSSACWGDLWQVGVMGCIKCWGGLKILTVYLWMTCLQIKFLNPSQVSAIPNSASNTATEAGGDLSPHSVQELLVMLSFFWWERSVREKKEDPILWCAHQGTRRSWLPLMCGVKWSLQGQLKSTTISCVVSTLRNSLLFLHLLSIWLTPPELCLLSQCEVSQVTATD